MISKRFKKVKIDKHTNSSLLCDSVTSAACSELVQEVTQAYGHYLKEEKGATRPMREGVKHTIKLFMANLINNEGLQVSTGIFTGKSSKLKNHYDYLGSNFNFKALLSLTSYLVKIGFLEKVAGHTLGKTPRPTRFWIKNKSAVQASLVAYREDLQTKVPSEESNHVTLKLEEDGKIRTIQYKNFSFEDKLRTEKYDTAARNQCEILSKNVLRNKQGLKVIPTSLTFMFNNEFNGHGRFYFNLQGLPSADRRGLTVNGEEVVELDYVSNGATIISAKHGVQLNGDAYTFGDYTTSEDRKLIKLCFNRMCGNKSKKAAIMSVLNTLTMDDRDITIPEKAELKIMITEAVEAIEEEYDYLLSENELGFYKRNSNSVMRIESTIAFNILSHFISMGEVILPIHDGFIVRKTLHDELEHVMMVEYSRVLGTSFTINVKKEG